MSAIDFATAIPHANDGDEATPDDTFFGADDPTSTPKPSEPAPVQPRHVTPADVIAG